MIQINEIKSLKEQYGSPLYVFDISELEKRIVDIRKILGDEIQLCYAIKANPFLIEYMNPYVDKFEICSPGEYRICKKKKIESSKLILSGVNKTEDNICETYNDGFGGIYTIESNTQLEKINNLYMKNGKKATVIVRLTSGNQFGITKESIFEIIKDKKRMPAIEMVGIHYYSGTQKKNFELIENEIMELVSFCDELTHYNDTCINTIEYGPGLFVDYFNDNKHDLRDISILKKLIDKHNHGYSFTIELGRYLVASCGLYITEVVDIKRNNDTNYCIVDGGIHHISYYGQLLGIRNPIIYNINESSKKQMYTICGSLCTANDVMAKKICLSEVNIKDILCFDTCGAYSAMEGCSLLLSRDLPKIVVRSNESAKCVRGNLNTYLINSTCNSDEVEALYVNI